MQKKAPMPGRSNAVHQYERTDYSAQTIYVRVTNDITGCYTIVNNISVHPLPEVVAVTDYIICELNTDGTAGFALTECRSIKWSRPNNVQRELSCNAGRCR
ncbi:MAG: hypothetical protein R2812_09705 [Gelidibacter sp.]